MTASQPRRALLPSCLTLSVLALAAVALPPAQAAQSVGTPSPFAGAVVEGQTMKHFFATPPPDKECILPVTWNVVLTYAPASDVLTLSANGLSDTGSDGSAQVSFEGPCSTSFLITVAGTDVALVAEYVVKVHSGPPGS